MNALGGVVLSGFNSFGVGFNEGMGKLSLPIVTVNVLGYIPGVGAIIGIARMIIEGISAKMNGIGANPVQLGRGVVEVLGLGIIFLPFDILFSR